jgi:hypothetical protein
LRRQSLGSSAQKVSLAVLPGGFALVYHRFECAGVESVRDLARKRLNFGGAVVRFAKVEEGYFLAVVLGGDLPFGGVEGLRHLLPGFLALRGRRVHFGLDL